MRLPAAAAESNSKGDGSRQQRAQRARWSSSGAEAARERAWRAGAGAEPAPGTLSGELLLPRLEECGVMAQAVAPHGTIAAWPAAQRQTAKAVYKSNRGCNHVPRRRHRNLVVACNHAHANGSAAWHTMARHGSAHGSARLGTARHSTARRRGCAAHCPALPARLRSAPLDQLRSAPAGSALHGSALLRGEARGACASLTPHTVKYKSTL